MKNLKLLLLCFLISCSLSKDKKEIINRLNVKYADYSFSDLNDVTGLYLSVKSNNENSIDSNEIRNIYFYYESKKNNLELPWKYMVIYNSKEEYQCTVTRNLDEKKLSFFRDGIN